MSRCILGEHDVSEDTYISGLRICVDCYNISQLQVSGFAHKLQPLDHFRLTSAGYFFSPETGYVKL